MLDHCDLDLLRTWHSQPAVPQSQFPRHQPEQGVQRAALPSCETRGTYMGRRSKISPFSTTNGRWAVKFGWGIACWARWARMCRSHPPEEAPMRARGAAAPTISRLPNTTCVPGSEVDDRPFLHGHRAAVGQILGWDCVLGAVGSNLPLSPSGSCPHGSERRRRTVVIEPAKRDAPLGSKIGPFSTTTGRWAVKFGWGIACWARWARMCRSHPPEEAPM